jgi:threonine/homoserine/homoserine lactone efflux protein
LAFLLGYLIGLLFAVWVFVLLAEVLPAPSGEPSRWASWLRVILGAGLLVLGVRMWFGRKVMKLTPTWMRSVQSASPAAALRLGFVLAALNPKALVFAAGAGLAIDDKHPALSAVAVSITLFTLVASISGALPVLLYAVLGDRIRSPLRRAKDWLERNSGAVTAVVLIVIGGVVVAKGVSGLSTSSVTVDGLVSCLHRNVTSPKPDLGTRRREARPLGEVRFVVSTSTMGASRSSVVSPLQKSWRGFTAVRI